MNHENRVTDPNPYGPIEAEDIERFERTLPSKLPGDYRDYLLKFNGGDFEKTSVPANKEKEDTYSISEFFALYRGPEASRLEQHWDLAGYYDLADFSHLTKAYLAFAMSGTGDVFLLKFATGEVLVYLHDSVDDTPVEGPRGTLVRLAGSFADFVSRMISKRELLQDTVESDPDFAARLEQLKKDSGLWD